MTRYKRNECAQLCQIGKQFPRMHSRKSSCAVSEHLYGRLAGLIRWSPITSRSCCMSWRRMTNPVRCSGFQLRLTLNPLGGGWKVYIFRCLCSRGEKKKKKVGLYCHLLAAHTSLFAHPTVIGQVKEKNILLVFWGVNHTFKVHFQYSTFS